MAEYQMIGIRTRILVIKELLKLNFKIRIFVGILTNVFNFF